MTDSIKVWVYSVMIKSAGWLSGQADSSLEPEQNCVLPISILFYLWLQKRPLQFCRQACERWVGYCSAYSLNICSKLCPNEGASQTSVFQCAASESHLATMTPLRHCSSQLVVNSPLLHCPSPSALETLIKFYFIISPNLMQGGFLLSHLKRVAERSPGSSATQNTATMCIVQQSECLRMWRDRCWGWGK